MHFIVFARKLMHSQSTHARLMETLEKGERDAAPSFYEMWCSFVSIVAESLCEINSLSQAFSPMQCIVELPCILLKINFFDNHDYDKFEIIRRFPLL